MRLTSLYSISTLGEELSILLRLEAGTCKFLLRRGFECSSRNHQPNLAFPVGNLTQVTNVLVGKDQEIRGCSLAKRVVWASDSWKSLVGN